MRTGRNLNGVLSHPPSIAPTFLKLDLKGALSHGFFNVVLVFFLVELFDATGTLMGVAKRAGLLVPERIGRLHKSLFSDASPAPTKFALAHLGLCLEDARLPIVPASEASRSEVLAAMREAGVI